MIGLLMMTLIVLALLPMLAGAVVIWSALRGPWIEPRPAGRRGRVWIRPRHA